MKTPEEYVIIREVDHWADQDFYKEEIIEWIRQAQLDAIDETVKLCAEKADIDLIQEWEGIETGYKNKVTVSKTSILNCAEILKKQING